MMGMYRFLHRLSCCCPRCAPWKSVCPAAREVKLLYLQKVQEYGFLTFILCTKRRTETIILEEFKLTAPVPVIYRHFNGNKSNPTVARSSSEFFRCISVMVYQIHQSAT
jgi:hypothetical protein